MASIFISHSSKDADVCDAVGSHLQQRGHSPLFIHRNPGESDSVGDQDWASKVGERAATYEIFVALLSRSWYDSDECKIEANFARRSGRTILPLRLDEDAPIADWINANAIPFSRGLTDEDWRLLDQALTRVGANPDAFEPHEDREPFPGLQAFEREDAAVYFGRDGDIREVREMLRRMRRGNRESEHPRQCLIVGPSGAGKSSLMQAGVLARLEREPHEWLCPKTVSPRGDLIAALEEVLKEPTGLSGPRIREALTSGKPDDLKELARKARERQGQPDSSLLLSIDQMEEAFAPGLINDTLALLEAHKGMEVALDDPMPVIILGTLRAEHYAGLCARTDLAALPLVTHPVAPLPIEYLSEVIRGPLRIWNRPVRDVYIESAVVDRILKDARRIGGGAEVGTGDVLPLVAIVLSRLWKDHAHTDWFAGLREQHYEETGGLEKIINKHAKDALQVIWENARVTEAEVLAALVPAVATADEHGNRVRAWSSESAFDTAMRAALQILCDKRLLHTDVRKFSGEDGTPETVYSVAHEVVLRQWTALAEALDAQAEHLMLKARLREEASAWARARSTYDSGGISDEGDEQSVHDPDSYLLLEGDRLTQARMLEWSSGQGDEVTEYISACEAKQKDRVQTLAERERLLDRARQQYLASCARQLTDGGNHLGAMRLALAACACSSEGEVHGAVAAVLASAATSSALRRCLEGHGDFVTAVAWSPDGRWLASGGHDAKVIVWDLTAREPRFYTLTGHTERVVEVAWSPDGRRLASACGDETVVVWDVAAGGVAGKTMTHAGRAVAWSPNGRWLATGSANKTVSVWDPVEGECLMRGRSTHPTSVLAVTWSPDGLRLLSGDGAGWLMQWEPTTGECFEKSIYAGNNSKVRNIQGVPPVAWSPDCRQLASAYRGHVFVRDPGTGERLGEAMADHNGTVEALAWSPSGRRLVSGGRDSKLIVWNPSAGAAVADPITGHADGVNAVAWSPDGACLASASFDTTLIVWDAATCERMEARKIGNADKILRGAWSPTGCRLVSISGKELSVWNPTTGERMVKPMVGHTDLIRSVAWSPDGLLLASASDNEVIVWDSGKGERVTERMTGHTDCIWKVAWSPDGCRLVSVSDNELIVWDPVTGERVLDPLSDHVGPVTAVAWSLDDCRLVSASKNELIFWDPVTGERLFERLTGHSDAFITAAWSPDGRRLASATKEELTVWDPETGERVFQQIMDQYERSNSFWRGSMASFTYYRRSRLAWSPEGCRLASVSDSGKQLMVLDPATGQRVIEPISLPLPSTLELRMSQLGDVIRNVEWSPDGSRLAVVIEDQVIVWDPATGERVGEPLAGDVGAAGDLAWSPDGRRLATASDGALRMWNLPWEYLLSSEELARTVARRRLQGAEQLGESECQILRELDGREPDSEIIPARWGRGGPEDDPFGNPLDGSHYDGGGASGASKVQ